MFCRNCGKEISDKAIVCVNCGVRPFASQRFCQECGSTTRQNQEICVNCGVRLRRSQKQPRANVRLNTDFSNLSPYYQKEFRKIYESGEKYKGKWNWAAFTFAAIWALTKGVWVAPLIALLGSVFTWGGVGVVYWFIFAIRGNYMYYCSYVKGKQIPI